MNIWLTLKELVTSYVFNGDLTSAGQWGVLCADLIATAGSIFIISLPFAVVWAVIKRICG